MRPPDTPRPGLRVVAVPAASPGPLVAEVVAHAAVLDEISPCLHRVGPSGAMVGLAPGGSAAASPTLAALRATGVPILPSITNVVGGRRSAEAVAAVLRDPARTARHVWAICDLVASGDHAGIDVDYQDVDGDDREAFGAFVSRLADALHRLGRRLSVTVRAGGSADEPAAFAQDYAVIGEAADEVRLMTFDYHGPDTVAGPPAPLDWVREVLAYATARIPTDKLLLGVTGSGHDWAGRRAVAVGHARAVSLAAAHTGGAAHLDPLSGDRWFRYTGDDGRAHEVWFEDADGIAAKRATATEAGVRGVYLRLSAAPDARLWERLAR